MARKEFYNQSECTVTVDGEEWDGLADGDSIRIIPAGGSSSVLVGTNSRGTAFANNPSGTVEIDVMAKSDNLAQAIQLWTNQKTSNARLFDITVTTGVNEFHTGENCSIENIGQISAGGTEMPKRTVTFNVETITLDPAV